MFSDNAKTQIAACRFCWMCRHVCPVGLATGKESCTPRGRAVLANYTLKGMPIEGEIAPDMFACCLCKNCESWCETAYRPTVFIREARTEAVVGGYVPEYVAPVVDRVLATGSIFENSTFAVKASKAAADVLLVVGETARAKQNGIIEALMSVLKKAGVDYTVLENEPAVGAMMYDLVGEVDEVKKVAEKFAKAANDTGAKTLVALDPAEAAFLKQQVPEWGIKLGCEVVTATAFVAGLLASGKLKVTKPCKNSVTYHDPCRLARDLEETEPARDILKAVGAELKEMYLNKKDTRCCGGEVLASHSSATTDLISKTRVEDAQRTGADFCITACPGCADLLGKIGGALIKDIFVLVDECC